LRLVPPSVLISTHSAPSQNRLRVAGCESGNALRAYLPNIAD
jgi:hypothetical protein